VTFDDDFGDNADEWDLVGDDDGAACTYSSGALHITDQQNCYFQGGAHGTVPTEPDQWAYYDMGAYSGVASAGPSIRGKGTGDDAEDDEYNYILEWETGANARLRACDGEHSNTMENDCDDLLNYNPSMSDPTSDSGVIFAVAGDDTDTEFAIWLIQDTTSNSIADECDTDEWIAESFYATYCVTSVAKAGEIVNPKLTVHCDCGDTTDCVTGAAPDYNEAGYPHESQLYVGYGQTGSLAMSAERFCGGNL
jgi:hypothetical protein